MAAWSAASASASARGSARPKCRRAVRAVVDATAKRVGGGGTENAVAAASTREQRRASRPAVAIAIAIAARRGREAQPSTPRTSSLVGGRGSNLAPACSTARVLSRAGLAHVPSAPVTVVLMLATVTLVVHYLYCLLNCRN